MEWGEDTLLVSLRGPLVYETLAPLEACWKAVRAKPRPCVVLDLSEVTFMASPALASLVGLWHWLKARGYGLRLSALSLTVRHILHRTRLEQIFPVEGEPFVTEALPSPSRRARPGAAGARRCPESHRHGEDLGL
jgi:anti-anti-sigma factor